MPDARPNIVWLMAEDIGHDLACYGMKAVQTPVLDELARTGRKYTNCFCTNPICSPNRSAMMVGVHQVVTNSHMHRSNRNQPLPAPYRPITSYLREAGYTCIIGSDVVLSKGRKTDCNFKHEQLGPYDGVSQFGLFDKGCEISPEDAPFFAHIQLKVTHRGDWWNGVRRQSEHPVDPAEAELPPYLADTPKIRLDWATYLDTVEHADHEVALLQEDLAGKGLLDNTVIIFIGDNGRCNIRGKGYVHETGLRVPLIIAGPERWVEQAEVENVVCTNDISTTVLQLAGVPLPAYMEARPLIGTDRPHSREYVYSARDGWDEVNECMRTVSTKQHAYIRNYLPELPYDQHQAYLDFHRPAVHEMRRLKAEGKLSGPTALFFADCKPAEELYDMVHDPHQLTNLADDPASASILADLRAKMADWQGSHVDLGLRDYATRECLPSQAGKIREWLQREKPDEWQRLQDGEIGEHYTDWARQLREQ
jgi:N-sulfoglucosamine sulfohydrolase